MNIMNCHTNDPFALLNEQCISWVSTLAPPTEYGWTVRVWRWCVLVSNYIDHLLLLLLYCYALV